MGGDHMWEKERNKDLIPNLWFKPVAMNCTLTDEGIHYLYIAVVFIQYMLPLYPTYPESYTAVNGAKFPL